MAIFGCEISPSKYNVIIRHVHAQILDGDFRITITSRVVCVDIDNNKQVEAGAHTVHNERRQKNIPIKCTHMHIYRIHYLDMLKSHFEGWYDNGHVS